MSIKQKILNFIFRSWISEFFVYLENKGLYYKYPKHWHNPDKWEANIKASFPVRFFIRSNLENFESLIENGCRAARRVYRWLFKPMRRNIAKAVPRLYIDADELMVRINFEFLLSFEKELEDSIIDFDSDQEHRDFAAWVKNTCIWIREGKPNLERKISELYAQAALLPPIYSVRKRIYQEISDIEANIYQTDSNILKDMAEKRSHFVTW